MSAVVSSCSTYRYRLERVLASPGMDFGDTVPDADGGAVLFVMLNPSTADADVDDATIRRCKAFAARHRAGSLIVVNLYGFRATDPQDLVDAHMAGRDVVGPDADEHIAVAAAQSVFVVAGWGAKPAGLPAEVHRERVWRVMHLVGGREVWSLGVTKKGAPRHPLYLPAGQVMEPWPA